MAPQPVHKTKHPDDCPIVEELAIESLARAEQAIRASIEKRRTAHDLVEETKRIADETRRLNKKH
jgi:hypothetical protein